ncbi:MAG: phosphoribosyltransferase family protein [archaeon]
MKFQYYKPFLIHNKGERCDVSPLFENSKVFHNLIIDLIKPFRKERTDKIACLDALGFILGSAIAYKLNKSLVLIRKKGKIPGKNKLSNSFKDYTKKEKSFEIRKNSIKRGEKILIVDEWIETGAQMKSAIKLIEKQKGKIIGITALNADMNKGTKVLFDKYNLKPIRVGGKK